MANDDRNASATYSFIVDVSNEAPQIIGSISPYTVYDNISFTKTVNFSNYFQESDAHQSLYFSCSGVPSFMTNSSIGDAITFTGNASSALIGSNFTIQLVVNDGYEQSTLNFTINVVENEPPTAPHVTLPVSLNEGQQGTLTFPSFTDAESDSITYT